MHFLNSLLIALVTTAAATVLGTLCALGLHTYKQRTRTILSGFMYVPILVPDILMGLSMLLVFSQLHWELGKFTLIIAHITFSISFVVILLSARLASMGKTLQEAASDLGGNAVANVSVCDAPSPAARHHFCFTADVYAIYR
ncbi:hypothetical protein GCM10020331_073160 [Ectobacillus funiculus]